jgi:hypothetical protein
VSGGSGVVAVFDVVDDGGALGHEVDGGEFGGNCSFDGAGDE